MVSMRSLPLFLILSLFAVPSEIEARVGRTTLRENEPRDNEFGRKLGNGYRNKNKPSHNGHYFQRPTHNGQWYIKRKVDPSEYYHNLMPSNDSNDDEKPNPTKKPTHRPTTNSSPEPTNKPPTEAPIPPPTNAPTESAFVVPPTFNPAAIVVDIVVVPPEDEDFVKPVLAPPDAIDDQNNVVQIDPPTLVQTRIAAFALRGGAEFEDPSSYQSAALKRVEEQTGAEDMSDAKLIQYYALYSIFEATNARSNDFLLQARTFGDDERDIPGWKITSGWTETNLDPCEGEWYGISCVDDKVIRVDLFDNGLTGNFAPEIKLLAGDGEYSTGAGSLVQLDIFNNEHMSNDGDNSWIADLGSQLGYLFLQNTAFSGKLPPTFPPGLVELDIANSLITGSLDGAAFENLSSLRFLLMDGVQFDSSIPSEIASLPNLEYFFAIDAMITGDLSYMESMPVIFEHWVDRNPQLGGQIPSFLGSLTTLQSFSIADCGFTGTIPESLGNLGLMQQMWLYKNQLSGEVPASMGRLSFMRIFEVEGNNLSDSMPQSICENFSTGMLEVLGADCDKLDCPCCTCCSMEECRGEN